MTPDDIARKVAEALPCDFGGHDRECIRVNGGNCPAFFRPAVEALVREAYEAGYKQGEGEGDRTDKRFGLRPECLLER